MFLIIFKIAEPIGLSNRVKPIESNNGSMKRSDFDYFDFGFDPTDYYIDLF